MKERTSLAEECGWSASVPVWASSKEAVSVETVSTAIQSSNQRDRVRVATARDVGADPSNRRIATCAPFKDYSSEHESDVNVRRGGAWSLRLETLSAETERTFASNDAIEPRVFDGDAAAVPWGRAN